MLVYVNRIIIEFNNICIYTYICVCIHKYSYKFLLSRKIDSSDSIKYQLSLGKMINKYSIGMIVNGEESNGSNMTIKLSYEL